MILGVIGAGLKWLACPTCDDTQDDAEDWDTVGKMTRQKANFDAKYCNLYNSKRKCHKKKTHFLEFSNLSHRKQAF